MRVWVDDVLIIDADNFSVRWTRSLFLTPGRYRFSVTSDDGARLRVNGQQIINAWQDQTSQTVSGEIELSGGSVPVQLEYYENTGRARVTLSWAQVTVVPQPVPRPSPVGVVQGPRLNVRVGPGFQYGAISPLSSPSPASPDASAYPAETAPAVSTPVLIVPVITWQHEDGERCLRARIFREWVEAGACEGETAVYPLSE